MRVFCIILNIALVGISLTLLYEDGWPSTFGYQIMVSILVISPIVTLTYLATLSEHKKETWISLFLERKKAEERKRINEVRNDRNTN